MRAALHQVVTYADHVFHGNPAHVLTVEDVPDPRAMAAACALIGSDVLAVVSGPHDTAPVLGFFTPDGPHPGAGHATHAAAHVVMEQRGVECEAVSFRLADGGLRETRRGAHGIAVIWPVMPYEKVTDPSQIASAIGIQPAACFVSGFGYVAVLPHEADIANLSPNLDRVAVLDRAALIVTSLAAATDIAIRVFAPRVGLPEDPVCGTAHRIIVPYWADYLGKPAIHSRHLSPRGGDLWCNNADKTVTIAGASVTSFVGVLNLPDRM